MENDLSDSLKAKIRKDSNHGVAPVVAENHNVNGRGVIGHTDSPFLGFVFPVFKNKSRHEVSMRRYSLVNATC